MHLKGLETCSFVLLWKWTCGDIIAHLLLSSENKQVEIWKPGCRPSIRHKKSPLPFGVFLPTSEVTEQIAISSHSKSEVKEKTKLNKEIDPGAPMEFYNQTHIPDTTVLSKSPLKCKNLICQHVYIISSITVQAVALCGDTGLQTPGTLKWEDVDWLEFTLGRIVLDSSAIRLLTLIPDTLSLHWD